MAEAMKRFNDAFKVGHYAEAETAAMEAHELDPDNTTAVAAMTHRQDAEEPHGLRKDSRSSGRTPPWRRSTTRASSGRSIRTSR